MKCPSCQLDIERVKIWSRTSQDAAINPEGRIIDRLCIRSIWQEYDCTCTECGESLSYDGQRINEK